MHYIVLFSALGRFLASLVSGHVHSGESFCVWLIHCLRTVLHIANATIAMLHCTVRMVEHSPVDQRYLFILSQMSFSIQAVVFKSIKYHLED